MTALVSAEAALRERRWGFEAGVRAIQEAGRDMLPLARRIWMSPRYAELVEQRAVQHTTPCPSKACGGRCSRCVRAVNVAKNRRLYGQDDYPGSDALALHRAAL
jgi:hypothetical protein